MDNDSIDNLKEFLQMQKMTPSEVVAAQKAAQLAGERQSAQMDAPFGRIEFFDSGSKAGI